MREDRGPRHWVRACAQAREPQVPILIPLRPLGAVTSGNPLSPWAVRGVEARARASVREAPALVENRALGPGPTLGGQDPASGARGAQ